MGINNFQDYCKLADRNHFLESENFVLKHQVSVKDSEINRLKFKINYFLYFVLVTLFGVLVFLFIFSF